MFEHLTLVFAARRGEHVHRQPAHESSRAVEDDEVEREAENSSDPGFVMTR